MARLTSFMFPLLINECDINDEKINRYLKNLTKKLKKKN